ncbi:MAG: hypothetical protein EA397_04890 [Deltaproteobacteria bacterium]|nr:MAG: hypothetical protein EA397_04890 [Deltaproteobacteria bacterium]
MRLHVSIAIGENVVQDEVLDVVDGLRIGEHDDAAVCFPGADLIASRHGAGLRIGGHRLIEGETLRLHYGEIRVTLDLMSPDPSKTPRTIPFDVAMPILLAGVVLLMLTSQVAQQVLIQKADTSSQVARAVEALLLPPEVRVLGPPQAFVPRDINRLPQTTSVRYIDDAQRGGQAR